MEARGFTLVELMIALSLSLMVLAAVFSSYLFLAKNFTRQLGVSSANQPTLQSQAARTIAAFEEDVKMAQRISAPSGDTQLTLTISTSSTPKNIYYYFNGSDNAATVPLGGSDETIAPHTLVRKEDSGPIRAIHSTLLTCRFTYFDASSAPFTVLDSGTAGYSSPLGIKQVSLAFTSQSGNAAIGTLTPVFSYASPRVVMRNKPLLP